MKNKTDHELRVFSHFYARRIVNILTKRSDSISGRYLYKLLSVQLNKHSASFISLEDFVDQECWNQLWNQELNYYVVNKGR